MGLASGIREPGSWKNLFRIPDPGVKKAPDPGSATLQYTKLRSTLLSCEAPFWAFLHPSAMRCILLSCAAFYWAALHTTELRCILLSCAASQWVKLQLIELRCNLLSYDATFWATLLPFIHAAPYRATLHPFLSSVVDPDPYVFGSPRSGHVII
jgi:hypothetical protein